METVEAAQPPGQMINLGDVYYTLFRHKWKILICSVLGIGAALAVNKFKPAPFQSEAKLLIRYVMSPDTAPSGPGHDDQRITSTDPRGETIIASEIEILSSWDLSVDVAKAVGPEKILAAGPGGKDPLAAASLIQKGLVVEVPPKTSVVSVKFNHRDPDVTQQVLRELIDGYLKKHLEFHRAPGGDFLTQETDNLRARLTQTEEDLLKKTNQAGIISLEDYKKSAGERSARLQQDILALQAELSERQSMYQEYSKELAPEKIAADVAQAPVPNDQIDAYQKVTARLTFLRQREQEFLTQFTEESPRVKELRTQITEAEEQKRKLLVDFPTLATVRSTTATNPGTPGPGAYDPAAEAAKINALQARLKTLNAQTVALQAEGAKVKELEISIRELQRRRDLEESNYRYYAARLEQKRINDALGENRMSNISEIQTPTPPSRDLTKTYKTLGGVAAAGIFGGIGWAFLIEILIDRSIRRSSDIDRFLHLPLFLTLPKRRLKGGAAKKALPGGDALALANGHGDGTNIPGMEPYYETLRDRLISYFESVNIRHKPKLIAVTGLGSDSGVTTVAAGLARSFSETGEGRVLLVDMTRESGSSLQFEKGKPVQGLEHFLEMKDSAPVENNLYVVTENSSGERLAKGLPQRFGQLVPKLKASNFDYIIFDMPAVSQISITPRLASFMDKVLLVLESEKTDRDLAAVATSLLARSKASVGVVLNKTKRYVPGRLHQDREFLLGA